MTKNKEIKQFEQVCKDLKPVIEEYEKKSPKAKLFIPLKFGVSIKNVDIRYLSVFQNTPPEDYNEFLNTVKKYSMTVAICGF